MVTALKGLTYSKADIDSNGQIPIILYGELYTNFKDKAVIDKSILQSKRQYKTTKSIVGDVIFPTSGETPYDISNACAVMKEGIHYGGDLTIMRPNKTIFGPFLAYAFRGPLKKAIYRIAQGDSIVHLSFENVKKLKLSFPGLAEQKKIADLLQIIDKRIEVQRKTIEDLKKLSKALKQKAYRDVTRAKPVCLLSAIFKKVSVKNKQGLTLSVYTASSSNGLIKEDDFFSKKISSKDLKNYQIIKRGDYVFNKSTSNNAPYGALIQFDEEIGQISPLYFVFRPTVVVPNAFIEMWFESEKAQRQLKRICKEGARNHGLLNISLEEFLSLSVPVATNYEMEEIAKNSKCFDLAVKNSTETIEVIKEFKKRLQELLIR